MIRSVLICIIVCAGRSHEFRCALQSGFCIDLRRSSASSCNGWLYLPLLQALTCMAKAAAVAATIRHLFVWICACMLRNVQPSHAYVRSLTHMYARSRKDITWALRSRICTYMLVCLSCFCLLVLSLSVLSCPVLS